MGGSGARAAWRIQIRRPLLAGDRASQMLLQTLTELTDIADSKSSSGTPPLPPTLSAESLFSHLRLIFQISHFGGRSKIYQNSDLYQTFTKSQQSNPWIAKARFWNHFG